MVFEPVIGLEIHVQLATASKIFSSSSTTFGKSPNSNTDAVCLGLPGALPVLNEKVVESAVKLGLATHCQIRLDSQFARKHYFYPDLPKGYQISQYDRPICEHGWVNIDVGGNSQRIGITRIHMEEDAGKLVHEEEGGNYSYVDLNRAGVPLLEIVSEPEFRDADAAKAYMEKIHSIVTYLGISDGDLEKGHLRCDANVSIRPVGQVKFGTRTEIKNINSFKFVQQAINYEIERQTEEVLEGRQIFQETRLWDAVRKVTFSMRKKEDAHDYRYFPDPDLPIVLISKEYVEAMQQTLPELPDEKMQRYMDHFGLSRYDADVLVTNQLVAGYFEQVVAYKVDPKLACNWVAVELGRVLNDTKEAITELKVKPVHLAELIELIQKKTISSKMAKQVFEEMLQTGKHPKDLIASMGIQQISDTAELEKLVDQVLADSPAQVEEYRGGKTKLFGFFVGQMMKATKGQANPEVVNQLLQEKLKA